MTAQAAAILESALHLPLSEREAIVDGLTASFDYPSGMAWRGEGARVEKMLEEGRASGFETPDAAYWARLRERVREVESRRPL